MKLASGGHLDDLDVTAFSAQGEEYLHSSDVRDSLLKLLLLEARSHPFAVVRAAELRRWVDEGAYTRILGGDYPRRTDDDRASPRDDVADAARHYRDTFEHSQDPIVSLLRDVGAGLGAVRDWAARVARPGPGRPPV
jgi:hypothetical protein